MSSWTYRARRRLVRIILLIVFFAVPFITVGGFPLLRFDVREMAIYVAGVSLSPSHIFPGLLLILSALFFFIFITQLFGRIWCGWLCPQTYLLDYANDLSISINKKDNPAVKRLKQAGNILIKLIISIVFVTGLILYSVPPYDFLPRLFNGDISIIWGVVAVAVFLNMLLVGRIFCKTVCPYSIFQSIMFDADTMRIGFHPERVGDCIKCNACVRTCPTDLDIREGLNNKCVSCASCVDACTKILSKLGKLTCVDYFYGRLKFRPFRINTVITLVIASIFLILGVVSISNIGDIYVKAEDIKNDSGFHSFNLIIQSKLPNDVTISINGADENITVRTEKQAYRLPKKDMITVPVTVSGAENKVKINVDIFERRNEYSKVLSVGLNK